MNRGVRFTVIAALLLFSACREACAWNSIGHMAVAYAAYQRLTQPEKDRVAVLLKKCPWYKTWVGYLPAGLSKADTNEYIFMMAATWPDEIKASGSGYTGNDTPPAGEAPTLNKGYTDKNAHKYWHFVDTPFAVDATALPEVPQPTIVEKIAAFRAALATSETAKLKSYDLVWLLHLVGDVHQPLHCTTRVSQAKPEGDLGGNDVVLTSSAQELHAFWDDAVGLGDTKNYKTAEAVGQALPAPDPALAGDDKEDDWAAESFALAKSSAYLDPPIGPGLGPFTPTPDYTTSTETIAKQRIALAGARLANLLKTALQCGDQTCAH
jgi:hypothetical protein